MELSSDDIEPSIELQRQILSLERPRGRLPDGDVEAAKAMLANPDIGVTQIAHRLGISPATLDGTSPLREPRIPRALRGALSIGPNEGPVWGDLATVVTA
jgi:hypothetical protein